MNPHEQTTLQDRCARCDCAEGGAPDAQALLAEARAQVVEAREERDRLRAHYDAAGPEHNLLALLDHYIDEANERVLEAQGLRARVAELEDAMNDNLARSKADQARRERDVRETLVQQYRAQHDVEAQRRGCPFCTCDVCAAAMRRTVLP